MSGPGRLVAFVATTDLPRATVFYRDVCGLVVRESNDYATVFDSAGTEVRVTTVEAKASAPYTVLGWAVPDLDQAVGELTARGAAFSRFDGMDQDASFAWTAPDGTRVAWFPDPDGNLLSVSTPPRGSTTPGTHKVGDSSPT